MGASRNLRHHKFVGININAEINGTLDATLTCNFDGAARLDGGRPRLVRDERQLAEEPALR